MDNRKVEPNARRQPLPEAGATQERTLEAVGWTPWLGCGTGTVPHFGIHFLPVVPPARPQPPTP
jgi:hypothetical protein